MAGVLTKTQTNK